MCLVERGRVSSFIDIRQFFGGEKLSIRRSFKGNTFGGNLAFRILFLWFLVKTLKSVDALKAGQNCL